MKPVAFPLRAVAAPVIAGLAACLAVPDATAQSTSPPSDPQSGWQFSVTPYLWATGLSGRERIGAAGATQSVDADFSSLAKKLEIGGMLALEARRGPWGALADLYYVRLSASSGPLQGGALGTADLENTLEIYQFGALYRVTPADALPVDLLGGVRYTRQRASLALSPSSALPAGRYASTSIDWADGFVGLRAVFPIAPRWSLTGYADIGAGGTDLSWQLAALLNYDITPQMRAQLGYRVLSQDYERTEFLYDMRVGGFVAGLQLRF